MIKLPRQILSQETHKTTEYPELFLRNLLRNETNELHSRTLHIHGNNLGESSGIT